MRFYFLSVAEGQFELKTPQGLRAKTALTDKDLALLLQKTGFQYGTDGIKASPSVDFPPGHGAPAVREVIASAVQILRTWRVN